MHLVFFRHYAIAYIIDHRRVQTQPLHALGNQKKFLSVLSVLIMVFPLIITYLGDFPGGVVVRSPPDNAGDVSSIPGRGRSHMPRSN